MSFGYMYAYSERPGTMAAEKNDDDVPFEVKKDACKKLLISTMHSTFRTKQYLGKTVEVFIEKESKKIAHNGWEEMTQNTVVVFPKENYKIR